MAFGRGVGTPLVGAAPGPAVAAGSIMLGYPALVHARGRAIEAETRIAIAMVAGHRVPLGINERYHPAAIASGCRPAKRVPTP